MKKDREKSESKLPNIEISTRQGRAWGYKFGSKLLNIEISTRQERTWWYKNGSQERAVFEQAKAFGPDQNRKREALREIGRAVSKKRIRYTPSFAELLLIEFRYISPLFWAVQGIFVGVLAILLEGISQNGGGLEDYLCWTSITAAWMGAAACGDLGRHLSRGMAELEQSCYFNLPQMWTIKMSLSGMADILILVLCSGRISGRTSFPFPRICLYVLVPFVLSNACCLLLLTMLRGGRRRFVQLAAALAAGLLAAAPAVTPSSLYTRANLWVWAAMLFAGAGLFLLQLRILYGKIRKGEIVCWS